MQDLQADFPQELKGNIIKPIKPLSFEFRGMTNIPEEIMFEDGCLDYLPEEEHQIGLYFDSYGCVSFSLANTLETFFRRAISLGKISADNVKWLEKNYAVNGRINFSDRDLVVMSGTNPDEGNDGATVLETIKKWGLVCETDAPWDFRNVNPAENNKALYYSYKRNKKSQEKAMDFLNRFEVNGEWVARENWLDASKYGTIQVYTNAWYKRGDKYYNPHPGSSGHAIMLARKSKEEIFDQYNPFLKEMEREEDFYYWGLKINITEKNMNKPVLQNNTLIMMVEGSGDIGMYLDGMIIKDDAAKLLAVWFARSAKNGAFTGGLVKSLTLVQWNLFDKTNLKGESIPKTTV